MVTDVIKWHWGPPGSQSQIQDYQNKDRLSVAGYFYYSENLNWAAQNFDWATCGPRAGHSCGKASHQLNPALHSLLARKWRVSLDFGILRVDQILIIWRFKRLLFWQKLSHLWNNQAPKIECKGRLYSRWLLRYQRLAYSANWNLLRTWRQTSRLIVDHS